MSAAALAVPAPYQRIARRQREGTVRSLVTRFPASWLTRFTGDTIRVATLADDYGRAARGEMDRRGCFAADKTIAEQLGLHPVTVQSAFAELEDRRNGGAGAVVRSTRTHRATKTRWVKPTGKDEKCATVSSHALTVLSANRFKVYAFVRMENDFETCPAAKEITQGLGITRETVRQALLDLLAEGWVSKTQEGGGRGHETRYQAHDVPVFRMTQLPLFPQPRQVKSTPPEPAEEAPHPGAGPDQMTLFDGFAWPRNPLGPAAGKALGPAAANPRDTAARKRRSFEPAPLDQAGEAHGGSARRALQVVARGRADDPDAAPHPPAVAVAGPVAASPETQHKCAATISATAYRVLRLLPLQLSSSQYVLASKAVEKAVAEAGGDIDRIADRVHRHLAGRHVTDPYAWITRRGLRNSPCPSPTCEDGRTWPAGANCPICRERYADRRGTPLSFRDRATAIYEVTWACATCDRPGAGVPPADGICRDCCPDAVGAERAPRLAADVRECAAAVRAGIRHKTTTEPGHDAQAAARERTGREMIGRPSLADIQPSGDRQPDLQEGQEAKDMQAGNRRAAGAHRCPAPPPPRPGRMR
ncbi:hypothetical protein [Streptomyces sp. NPDC001502]|uniref:hypothetical protein n=1 Tax=Streptomyces sp. NPDC001502 TaxID=3364578 RepID=UPI0036B80053